MATVLRVFDTLDTSTFLDGGSAANVDSTGTDSKHVDLSTWEGVHCFVEVDFPGAPTDDLVIEVLASNDSSGTGNGNYDSVPLFTTDNINVLFRYRRWRWETG